jgi:hypothetical protein
LSTNAAFGLNRIIRTMEQEETEGTEWRLFLDSLCFLLFEMRAGKHENADL